MFENPRRSRQARNFITNVPKILDLKLSSEQIFFRKLSSGAPGSSCFSNWYWRFLRYNLQNENEIDSFGSKERPSIFGRKLNAEVFIDVAEVSVAVCVFFIVDGCQ